MNSKDANSRCLGTHLHCDRVCKAFGGTRALDDVSLVFPSQGVVAVIGPNGAGKTTLLNVISGHCWPDSGSCYFKGVDITRMAAHRIARLGIVRTFQELRFASQLSVLDNVLLAFPHQRGENLLAALFRRGVRAEEERNRTKAMELLDLIGLQSKASDLASTLSFGQQKLLTLAVCLATSASVVALDEPAAAVDPDMADQLVETLNQLKVQGKLVLFIEHNMELVMQAADAVVVMDRGRVIANGPPKEILLRPEVMDSYVG